MTNTHTSFQLRAFESRLVREKAQLDDKRDNLISFFQTKTFEDLNSVDQELLHDQMDAMTTYSYIMRERISRIVPTPE